MTLAEIVKMQYGPASKILFAQRPDDAMLPMFIGYAGDRVAFCAAIADLVGNTASKAATADAARHTLAEHDCTAYAIVMEMWFTKHEVPKGEDVHAAIERAGLPSRSPDRREALMVYAEDDAGYSASGVWLIARGEDGKICGLTEQDNKDTKFEPTHMGGLLKPKVRN